MTIVVLRDGGRIAIEPLQAADGPAYAIDMLGGLSDESIRRRFLRAVPLPSARYVRELSGPDRPGYRILAAIDRDAREERFVGSARLVGYPGEPAAAEVAFGVIDGHQGRGIARALLTAMMDVATADGITVMRAITFASNAPALHLLRSLGDASVRRSGAEAEVEIPIP